jgi:hypothetical protein
MSQAMPLIAIVDDDPSVLKALAQLEGVCQQQEVCNAWPESS